MLVPILLALAVGVLFIYSSCFISSDLPVKSFYKKQMVWIAVGLAAYMTAALYDYRRAAQWSWAIYALCLVLLVMVLLFGKRIYGARRWLILPGTGFGLQPSELAKLATLLFLAQVLSLPDLERGRFRTFAGLMALVGAPLLLVLKQPDLGTAMVFLPPAMIMMFVGGISGRWLGITVAAGVLAAATVIGAIVLPEVLDVSEETRERVESLLPLPEYQQERIKVLIWPDRDPLGAGWNKNQSEIAVGSGGVWGKGYLNGTQNILGFLPRSVAPTDFIYSVIAEEKGFMGSLFIILLFASIVVFGMRIATSTPDRMGRLLCVGIVSMVFCHVWINIAMTVGLMPITGLPLPLLSYGGSFVVMTLAALGLLQSVYIRSPRRAA